MIYIFTNDILSHRRLRDLHNAFPDNYSPQGIELEATRSVKSPECYVTRICAGALAVRVKREEGWVSLQRGGAKRQRESLEIERLRTEAPRLEKIMRAVKPAWHERGFRNDMKFERKRAFYL